MLESLRFSTRLTNENVWDAFIIYTLIRQHERVDRVLVVDNTGDQKDRFTALMEEHNRTIILYGQDEVGHYCDKCTRIWVDSDGKTSEYRFHSSIYYT